jgi:hypothetical protein
MGLEAADGPIEDVAEAASPIREAAGDRRLYPTTT